ncbi:(Fe-S)-binding protein [Modestobacter sp. VKM Ac-2985]|uniref:(Fe-S)-binding protein n=1 Tax=Modestobacter sp. VKM Ac-2985 TaxID=3004139 RepID=UPI0022ABBC83|nr:heterodisulfide reductase-related iron-sulfur binding cluster [Modestobacter sp. VKM Ac-2985]MCZ2840146.1 heterodisulfide reductase-related iron-sulfur binding cluster [Modestobacter sp. VKM Ac-2985]
MTSPDPTSQADLHPEVDALAAAGQGSGIFDEHHPPADELISDCVHCGFCLPTCPTYALWGEEMDSPRGRIHLMKMGKEGAVELDDTYAQHFDACLGCMACVTACPSGVQYDKLIEAVRPQLERNHRRSLPDRLFRGMIFILFPYPSRLRVAAVLGELYRRLGVRSLVHRTGAIRLLPARLQAVEALMPPAQLRHLATRTPAVTPAVGTTRRRVGFLTGCVQRVFFADVNQATVRVLTAEGCEVVAPASQRCCGALSEHAGREPEALQRARELIDAFADAEVDTIVSNVAGCGSSLKEYGRLLRDDPEYAERAAAFSAKVRDVSELLAELEPVAPRHPIEARVAYHDACHLGHAQGVRSQPREVLRSIPGLQVTDIPEAEICCGSAGIYNLVNPEPAEELGRRKVEHVLSVQPDALATANPGCLLQIRRYWPGELPMFHPVELLDASIRGVDPVAAAGSRGRPALDARTSEPGTF